MWDRRLKKVNEKKGRKRYPSAIVANDDVPVVHGYEGGAAGDLYEQRKGVCYGTAFFI